MTTENRWTIADTQDAVRVTTYRDESFLAVITFDGPALPPGALAATEWELIFRGFTQRLQQDLQACDGFQRLPRLQRELAAASRQRDLAEARLAELEARHRAVILAEPGMRSGLQALDASLTEARASLNDAERLAVSVSRAVGESRAAADRETKASAQRHWVAVQAALRREVTQAKQALAEAAEAALTRFILVKEVTHLDCLEDRLQQHAQSLAEYLLVSAGGAEVGNEDRYTVVAAPA